MPGPARAGVVIYARHLDVMSRFYENVLGLRRLVADDEHHVLESPDIQVVLHVIPPHIAATVVIAVPPELREEQAIKPFFTVTSLAEAERSAPAHGGALFGPVWNGPGFRMRNGFDPEGNILQFRERAA
jgi:catechol 2,3-dioxygenase-like lactoylglutathione lyase family enzyme